MYVHPHRYHWMSTVTDSPVWLNQRQFHTHMMLLTNCELHNTYGGTCHLPQWWVYRQTLCESRMSECRHRHKTVTFLHSTHPVSRHRDLYTTRTFFFLSLAKSFSVVMLLVLFRVDWITDFFLCDFFYFISSCWVDLFFLGFFFLSQTYILIVILCGKYVLMFLFL